MGFNMNKYMKGDNIVPFQHFMSSFQAVIMGLVWLCQTEVYEKNFWYLGVIGIFAGILGLVSSFYHYKIVEAEVAKKDNIIALVLIYLQEIVTSFYFLAFAVLYGVDEEIRVWTIYGILAIALLFQFTFRKISAVILESYAFYNIEGLNLDADLVDKSVMKRTGFATFILGFLAMLNSNVPPTFWYYFDEETSRINYNINYNVIFIFAGLHFMWVAYKSDPRLAYSVKRVSILVIICALILFVFGWVLAIQFATSPDYYSTKYEGLFDVEIARVVIFQIIFGALLTACGIVQLKSIVKFEKAVQ